MIATASFLEDLPVQDVKAGMTIDTYRLIGTTPKFFDRGSSKVNSVVLKQTQVSKLVTASGIELVLTPDQQVVVINGGTVQASHTASNLIAVMLPNGTFRWERVASFITLGVRAVSALDCANFYAASTNHNQGFVLCYGP